MQAIKDKLHDMAAMRKAKSEAKEEENAEKEMAKTRVEVAHEVRMAREAEAAMDLHVQKAAEKVAKHETNINQTNNDATGELYGLASDQPDLSASGHHSSRDISPPAPNEKVCAGGGANTTGGPPTSGLL